MATIIVFPTNESGFHMKEYIEKYGAKYAKSYGHYGRSFAIPTVNIDHDPINYVDMYIQGFIAYAKGHHRLKFRILLDEQYAPLFIGSPTNCMFPETYRSTLGDTYNYFTIG